MKIKTFPLNYVESDLKKIGRYAKKVRESKEEFMKKAIEERMEKMGDIEEE